MRVQAKLLYDEVRAINQRCYVWLDPDERSTLSILRLLRGAPLKSKDGTELHCTVVYCNSELPETLDVPEDKTYTAILSKLNVWEDHKDRLIVVASLESEDLQGLHANLVSQGLKHSYPEYNPHISLATGVLMDARQRLWVTSVNQKLAAKPIKITFSPQLRGSPAI